MNSRPPTARLLLALLFSTAVFAWANPEPDLPVHWSLNKDSTCTVTVEVDPRCFTAAPMEERYLMKVDLARTPGLELETLKNQAADALSRWISFEDESGPALKPQFFFTFTGQGQSPLIKPDDPVVITGTWKFKPPARFKGARLRVSKESPFAVVVSSSCDGKKQPRTATLFAGETSHGLSAPEKSPP